MSPRMVATALLTVLFALSWSRQLFGNRPPLEPYRSTAAARVSRSSSSHFQLAPGELPGYTGWARPEFTLAGQFRVMEDETSTPRDIVAGQDWFLTLQCQDDDSHTNTSTEHHSLAPCRRHNYEGGDVESWFYVRAYGPAILTGTVEPVSQPHKTKNDGSTTQYYRVHIRPIDPGVYTVEVVLTFSVVPPLDQFPLGRQQQLHQAALPAVPSPNYEGYLLPQFPMQITVTGPAPPPIDSLPYCTANDLLLVTTTTTHERDTDSSINNNDRPPPARWRVVDSNRSPHHHAVTPPGSIQMSAYQQSYNSLGVKLQYERIDCQVPQIHNNNNINKLPVGEEKSGNNSMYPCRGGGSSTKKKNDAKRKKILHFILIGDSTMRLQRDVLASWLQVPIQNGTVRLTFHELYGGTLRCDRLSEPKLGERFSSSSATTGPLLLDDDNHHETRRVVLFNTGLHDIHRLCGSEWHQDRTLYLTVDELQMPCTQLYQLALQTLVDSVVQIPADMHLFQTTMSAWPKYGNYGVAWNPSVGQALPLDNGFVAQFNRIALRVLQDKGIRAIVDAYWVSLARPDNREIDGKASMGKKLSHPGNEVVLALVQNWYHVFLRTVCGGG
jgi:hypothetical protein